MNYDINTPQGINNSVRWVNALLNKMNDGGVWVIPRSGTVVTKISGKAKTCHYQEGFASDLSIVKVLNAAGWNFVEKGGEQPDGCQ